jgi:hypothetical protein
LASNENSVRINGGSSATLGSQTGTLSTGAVALGNTATTNTEGLDGLLPEVIFLPGPIPSTGRQLLERNQGAYYRITVA